MNTVRELKYGNTKCYLLNDRIMVDTNWAGSLSALFQLLKRDGVVFAGIQYLLITHFHPDHMGIAQDLANLGIKIVVFREQAAYLHRVDYIFARDKHIRFQPILDRDVMILSCADSRRFLAGAGVEGEVLHTPGHSADSVSVVLDNGIAIVGDLPPLRCVSAYDSGELEQSWNAILAHGINLVYYGHAKEERLARIRSIADVKL